MSTANGSGSRVNDGPGNDVPPWGVVLLAHGSQRGASRAECACCWKSPEAEQPPWCRGCPGTPQGLLDAVSLLQKTLGDQTARVILSCLEFIEPRPDQALKMLKHQGYRKVILLPFLLGNGKHATLELDEIIEEARAEIPDFQIFLADGLGAEPVMADLVLERVRSLSPGNAGSTQEPGSTGVLLVKAGTKSQYDDCQWLVDLGRMVEAQLGPQYAVAVAQSHYGDPTMEDAAADLVDNRRVSNMVAVPYLLFPGLILRRNVLGGLDRLEKIYPKIPISVTPPLGADQRIVEVAAQRVRQAWLLAEKPG